LSTLYLTLTEYICHKWPRICSVCRNHNPVLSSFLTYQCIRVSEMEQELPTPPEPMISPLFFVGLVFCVVFCSSLFVLIGHCIVCPSIYGFWVTLWYLLIVVLINENLSTMYDFLQVIFFYLVERKKIVCFLRKIYHTERSASHALLVENSYI
jgi:hypothetical protein